MLSDRPSKPLDAAETAYLFGCDVDELRDAQTEHLEQSEEWTTAAFDAAIEGDKDQADACQHEARAWASNANLLRDAVELCEARALAPVDWSLAEHARCYSEASAQRWHQFHVVCERLGLVVEESGQCREECGPDRCWGDDCECDGCVFGWTQCSVCGQARAARPIHGLNLSPVENDVEVVAAKQCEQDRLDEFYREFDAAVAAWRSAVGLV
ncbi:hypothetical protein [Gordonia alkaliphila]|uniref:hypothetical protein n=1 Tax=Gordonia alkaliphila TaxID=1053547 RepID=UPI0031EB2E81